MGRCTWLSGHWTSCKWHDQLESKSWEPKQLVSELLGLLSCCVKGNKLFPQEVWEWAGLYPVPGAGDQRPGPTHSGAAVATLGTTSTSTEGVLRRCLVFDDVIFDP